MVDLYYSGNIILSIQILNRKQNMQYLQTTLENGLRILTVERPQTETVSLGRGLKPGDIVTANPYFNCGSCYSCQRGFVNCCTDN